MSATALRPVLAPTRPTALAARQTVTTTTNVVAMCSHVRDLHHRGLSARLPRLQGLADASLVVSGDRRQELVEVHRLFGELSVALSVSMTREEHQLWPLIERSGTQERASAAVTAVDEQISLLSAEHDSIRELQAALRSATRLYSFPSDGCRYERWYRALAVFDHDVSHYLDDAGDVLVAAADAVISRR